MAQFDEREINEAKKRVWEMRNRASRFVEDTPQQNGSNKTVNTVPPVNNQPKRENTKNTQKDEKADEISDDKSFFVILALIMLLSKEGADNTLILALLYLLL